ncbi:MAG: exodeoxyribonuclease VII large subunit [Thermomicrobiales bacterium]
MLDTPRTVREVTDRIRDLFASDPTLADIWISGEVLELTVSRSGHVFFTLAGDDARMRCAMFRMNALRQRSLPSPGASCVAHGKIEVYPTDGSYQFYVDLIEEAGIGLAALELELLRQQLEAEGLFAESRKRKIPERPAVIGIITSSSGAVWHDIQNVMRRRNPFARLILASAAVQGDAAPAELVAALRTLLAVDPPDVIVIARGGGSASDLAAFNDENLIRAVFAAPVPVISAIGHETDWTLLDLVADLRAPTPSAAAELVSPAILGDLRSLRESLALHADRFERELAIRIVDVERIGHRIDQRGFQDRWDQLRQLQSSLPQAVQSRLDRTNDRLRHAVAVMDALSPAKTMERGYAFVEHGGTGRPVRAAAELAPGDAIRTRFVDGSVESLVTSTAS